MGSKMSTNDVANFICRTIMANIIQASEESEIPPTHQLTFILTMPHPMWTRKNRQKHHQPKRQAIHFILKANVIDYSKEL